MLGKNLYDTLLSCMQVHSDAAKIVVDDQDRSNDSKADCNLLKVSSDFLVVMLLLPQVSMCLHESHPHCA